MTERRRFFPARSVQQVPGRTVDLSMRLQRVPVAPAVAPAAAPVPGDPQPPVWVGWFDGADEPATEIQLETYVDTLGFPHGRFVVGPALAHVAGGVDVQWDVTFVPTLWNSGGSVIWEGAALESTLPLIVELGDSPVPPTRSITLPTFGDAEPSMYWPHEWRGYSNYDTVYEPLMVAAGNTLSVALETGGSPGVLEAAARVGATVLGTVRLTAYLEVSVPD